MTYIVPAVLPSSRTELEGKLSLLGEIPNILRVQIDVVDGNVATPASWPYSAPGELSAMAERGEILPLLDRLEYEIDLMCTDAEEVAGDWLALGASRLTFHYESMIDAPQPLSRIRRRYGSDPLSTTGVFSLGLAINLNTNVSLIESCLGEVSYVQCMGIAQIGRQGEPFDARVLEKVRELGTLYPELEIQVDGGVSLEHAKSLLALGVSSLVVGSAILSASDPATAFLTFDALESPYGV